MASGHRLRRGDEFGALRRGGIDRRIGVAKTTIAIYSQAYQLYVLACTKDPHRLFDLDPSSEILVVFQSLNKDLAKDVDYRRFRDMVDGSPFFATRFPVRERPQSRDAVPEQHRGQARRRPGDRQPSGQNVIGGIIDEVNFMAVVEDSKMKRDGTTYDQAVENYNAIARRRESRFMQIGTLPGMLCLVSSKNYPAA